MKQMLKVLTIFAVIGLLGWSEDIPRPAPLITEAEARSFLPMLRLPTNLPEGTEGPVFTLHFVQGQAVVTLFYSAPLEEFQIREASPALRDTLRPRPITQTTPRLSVALVENVSKETWPEDSVIEPREENREGYLLSIVSGTRCLDALCEEWELYTQAMTCDEQICAQIEGTLEEATAVRVLLSLFVR